jgi:glycosyltransferase involved in cell wall biosynthesis
MSSTGIAIVIITYNRPDDALELARNISSLQDVTTLCSEIIFVNNKSALPYTELETFIQQNPQVPFRYFKTDENLGVSRGRNFAIQQSSAPYLVFLDDDALFKNLDALPEGQQVMLKLSLPVVPGTFDPLVSHPKVLRVVALSGGYARPEACVELSKNKGIIAIFSRALLSDLRAQMSDDEFDAALGEAIDAIYEGSTHKIEATAAV